MRALAHSVVVGGLVAVLFGAIPAAHAQECEGVRMPSRITVEGRTLVLNGMGVREATAFNVNVYVAGLYLEGGRTRSSAEAVRPDKAKKLVLMFVRDVDREDIVEAWSTGFRQNAGQSFQEHRANLQRLNGWMTNVREGQEMSFTYVPGKGIQVRVGNRTRGTIEGDEFARVFFSIFVGPRPPNAGLKTGLLGGACG